MPRERVAEPCFVVVSEFARHSSVASVRRILPASRQPGTRSALHRVLRTQVGRRSFPRISALASLPSFATQRGATHLTDPVAGTMKRSTPKITLATMSTTQGTLHLDFQNHQARTNNRPPEEQQCQIKTEPPSQVVHRNSDASLTLSARTSGTRRPSRGREPSESAPAAARRLRKCRE